MTWLLVLAALSAAAAVMALGRPAPAMRLARIARPSAVDASGRGGWDLRAVAPGATMLLVAGGVLTIALRSPVLALAGVLAAIGFARWRRRRRRRQITAERRAVVIELCSGLTAELRAGRMPRDALTRAASGSAAVGALCASAVAAAESGGDVPAALAVAGRNGADALRWLAACWQVAEEQGAGLAAAAERLAEHGRADQAVRQEVSTQLAGPRATAALLGALPAVGVLLGTGLGAAPLDVLLRTPWGLGCLALGSLLTIAGVAWTERIARAAEEAT